MSYFPVGGGSGMKAIYNGEKEKTKRFYHRECRLPNSKWNERCGGCRM